MKYVGENYRNTYGVCVLKTTDVPERNQRRAKRMGNTLVHRPENSADGWSVILPILACRTMQFPSKPEQGSLYTDNVILKFTWKCK